MKTLMAAVLILGASFAQAQEMESPVQVPYENGGVSSDRWWTCFVKDAPGFEYIGQAYGSKERAKRAAFRECEYYSNRPTTCRLLRCR